MSGESLFLRRPKAGESEEDILEMQAQWEMSKQQKERPTVQIQRVTRKPSSEKNEPAMPPPEVSKHHESSGRFTIDLDDIAEEWTNQVLFDVQERNSEFLDQKLSSEFPTGDLERSQYSMDGGFPDVLDLSKYFSEDDTVLVKPPAGKSFFAAEFDRLNGVIDDATCSATAALADVAGDEVESVDFQTENEKYISTLSEEQVAEFRQEIEERLDPKVMAFLASRHKKKDSNTDSAPQPVKVSKFKQSRTAVPMQTEVKASTSSNSVVEREPIPILPSAPSRKAEVIDDIVKQLEVLDEFADRDEEEKYNRLATDAVQMDFATKCLRSMLPRQQQNTIRLFDNLKTFQGGIQPDELTQLAKSRIDDIKLLYLEEVKSGDRVITQFAAGLNPLVDGAWTLRPIRTVLDAVHQRENIEMTSDDVDLVRLSLLWTFLLHSERPSAFFAFAEPQEVYVRLAEVFLLGTSILEDDISMECVARLMNNYILKSAIEGRLSLRLSSKIAGLDAFMPFYEDLLKHYESYSFCDVQFARIILIGAYLNSSVGDSLECRFGIWTPKQHTARQMTLSIEDAADILSSIRQLSVEQAAGVEEHYYTQYVSLLGSYAAAIRDEKVTRERNPLMFTIAAEELGRFVQRHLQVNVPAEKRKEFDTLVEIVRSTVQGKVEL